ncbi:MAG: non-heme iron oxygenase ferredoxin subunit [Saccharospirillum sp.]|uniref:non-heme iron oxygenase ferredoxin subunit n=1 Tax=Saccharospirillum TaxID=231683 RepID=UPI003296CC91
MSETSNRVRVCSTEDVMPGEGHYVEVDELELAVFNVADKYFVTDNQCTHGPGSLSEGFLDGTVIECDFHGGAFDVCTGEVVAAPCMVPLKTYTVTLEGNDIMIDV